jgi:pimeloyl-ACP methyl ester carboxylesterase
MMTVRSPIAPYVQLELKAADLFEKRRQFQEAFRHLERAHVLGQNWTWQHVRVHWRMFVWGVRRHEWREVAGQAFRIVGAAAKTGFGLVPRGNTGGANVSPFRTMPIPEDLAAVLAKEPKPSRMLFLGFTILKFAVWLVWAAVAASCAPLPQDARTAIVDGHRVAFRVIGSGRPAIVMMSGLGDGMETFDDVAAELGKTRTVIVYDRAGYGGSERGTGPRDAAAAARELSGVLAQSGAEGPYVLSGHSLGGLLAEYYAAKHPDEVAGLILEESRPADFTRRCEESVRWALCVPPSWLVWLMPKGARDEAAALSRLTDQVENSTPMQNKPVLVLSRAPKRTGKHSFDTVWAEAQLVLAARYPRSRHLTRESGHYLHHEQRAWFVASVQAFAAGNPKRVDGKL